MLINYYIVIMYEYLVINSTSYVIRIIYNRNLVLE